MWNSSTIFNLQRYRAGQTRSTWAVLIRCFSSKCTPAIPAWSSLGLIWVCLKIVYPYTQWFCWSLSLLNGYFIGGIYPIFRHTHLWSEPNLGWPMVTSSNCPPWSTDTSRPHRPHRAFPPPYTQPLVIKRGKNENPPIHGGLNDKDIYSTTVWT